MSTCGASALVGPEVGWSFTLEQRCEGIMNEVPGPPVVRPDEAPVLDLGVDVVDDGQHEADGQHGCGD